MNVKPGLSSQRHDVLIFLLNRGTATATEKSTRGNREKEDGKIKSTSTAFKIVPMRFPVFHLFDNCVCDRRCAIANITAAAVAAGGGITTGG